MKAYYSLIYILTLCAIINGQNEKGRLVIETNVESSAIILNDELVGNGSIDIELETGTYYVIIKENPYVWGSEIIYDEVLIKNTEVKKLYSFEKKVLLDSDPTDAYVYKGKELIGHTPMFIQPSVGSIDLTKPSFKSTMNIDLKKMGEIPQKVQLEFVGEKAETLFRETIWFKALLGSAILVGGTAAYFKIKADKEYEEYLRTEDISYRDRTDQYDTYSGVSFGLLQLNFAAILYYLLAD